MDDENRKKIIFLENFFKSNKNGPLILKQPKQIGNFDLFGEKEDEKIEKPKKNSIQRFYSVNNNANFVIKKYNIIKESTIFKEDDSKKSFKAISNFKNHYKDYLFNIIKKNTNFSNTKFNTARIDNYFRQKSMLDINERYQEKLKNVSIQN
jgi:hypothetical protein